MTQGGSPYKPGAWTVFPDVLAWDYPDLGVVADTTDIVSQPVTLELVWFEQLGAEGLSDPSRVANRMVNLDDLADFGDQMAGPVQFSPDGDPYLLGHWIPGGMARPPLRAQVVRDRSDWAGDGLDLGENPAAQVGESSPAANSAVLDNDPHGVGFVLTTAGSAAPIVTFGEVVALGDDAVAAPLTDRSGPLINLDGFLSDIRFAGIDGSGFSAVILDTGIDLDHPFFGPDADGDGISDRIVFNYDFADSDADASDHHGHGSNVSSIVASSDTDLPGMAPGSGIIHLKVFSDSGSGSFSYIEQALQWVVDNATAYNIASVNMSLGDGGNHGSPQSLYGIADEIAALAALDVITVSASGNDFFAINSVQGVQYPSADPNSLSIGAVYDKSGGGYSYSSGAKAYSIAADAIAPFSQRDANLTDVFAPGAPITGAGPNGGLVTMHGTSQATPHIAGIAVLAQQLAMQELSRRLTVEEFTDLLATTGVTINDGDDEDDNVDNTGLDFSRVDVLALADAILGMVAPMTFHSVSATEAVKPEGDSGTTPFTFTVTRTGDTSVATDVGYAVTGGDADGADFGGLLPSGTLSFAADETSKLLTIDVSGDGVAETDEGFTVTLSGPSTGSGITTATAAGTIQNDDAPSATPTVVEVRVAAGSDDAEEGASGKVSLSSSDLELIEDGGAQTVGIRFQGIDVPQGAQITGAYLQFQVDEKGAGATTLQIRGEAADDTASFTSGAFDITSRAVTAASVDWSPPAWDTVGEAGAAQQSPDLVAVVQEIVDRGGWSAAGSMAFVISGAGKRVAESFNGKASAAPLLHIEYQEAPLVEPTTFHAISATDAVKLEGDSGTTPLTFTVSRTGDTSVATDVGYAVTGGGANGADFGGALPTGTLSFVADETSKLLTINVSGDVTGEADESFTVTLSSPSVGSAVTTATAAGTIQNDDAPSAEPMVVEVRVATGSDDAEEGASGKVSLTSSDLELIEDGGAQTVGIRFQGIDVPQGAQITSAYLQFQVDETAAGATTLQIRGEAADDTAAFSSGAFDITSRVVTAASVDWSPPAWDVVGEAGAAQQSPDLAAVVQEIVDRGGWSEASSMAFVISGSGKRVAESFDGSSGGAPLLHIEYETGPPPTTFHSITATDAVKLEGDGGTTPFTFTVTRTGDTSMATDVAYAVTGGGVDGTDFGGVLPAGTLSFAADETSKLLTIDVSGDTTGEADEGFTVTLSGPSSGSAVTMATAAGTIQNDDAPPAEPTVFEVRVATGSDDAEERGSGKVSLSSSDLELTEDGSAQTVGIRF